MQLEQAEASRALRRLLRLTLAAGAAGRLQPLVARHHVHMLGQHLCIVVFVVADLLSHGMHCELETAFGGGVLHRTYDRGRGRLDARRCTLDDLCFLRVSLELERTLRQSGEVEAVLLPLGD